MSSVLASEELLGATEGLVSWTPDDAHRIGVETVDGGFAVTHTYDGDGLLATAGDLTVARYPGTGRIHTITSTAEDANQVTRTLVETRAYDAFGGLESLLYEWEGTILYEAVFGRDALGRIVAKTETIGGVTDEYTYEFDLAGRLRLVEKNGDPRSTHTARTAIASPLPTMAAPSFARPPTMTRTDSRRTGTGRSPTSPTASSRPEAARRVR